MLRALVRKISETINRAPPRLALAPPPAIEPMIFELFAREWIKRRAREGCRSAGDYACILEKHLVPAFEGRLLHEIRKSDVRAFVGGLKERVTDGGLASNTALNIYGLLRNICSFAEAEDVIERTPCVLPRSFLPRKQHKQKNFQELAIYTRAEIASIAGFGLSLSAGGHPIPSARRVLYATAFMTGARLGELLALRWSRIDLEAEPLGRLVISESWSSKRRCFGSTKTGAKREIAIVDRLTPYLLWWKYAGFTALAHRDPMPDDLVFPVFVRETCDLKPHAATNALRRLHRDLDALGLRRRRFHDTRRTFVTLMMNTPGLDEKIGERVVWGRPSTVRGAYHEVPFAEVAREMAKIEF